MVRLLIAHGSSDPQWRAPLDVVLEEIRRLDPGQRVELCFMERSAPSLQQAVTELYGEGVRDVRLVAVLLSAGGKHLKVDLPAAIAALCTRFGDLRLELAPEALGAHPEVISAMARAALKA